MARVFIPTPLLMRDAGHQLSGPHRGFPFSFPILQSRRYSAPNQRELSSGRHNPAGDCGWTNGAKWTVEAVETVEKVQILSRGRELYLFEWLKWFPLESNRIPVFLLPGAGWCVCSLSGWLLDDWWPAKLSSSSRKLIPNYISQRQSCCCFWYSCCCCWCRGQPDQLQEQSKEHLFFCFFYHPLTCFIIKFTGDTDIMEFY